MKREELSIFYSLWLRCFVVMLQYVLFFGSKPTFWKPSQSFFTVGAPNRKLTRQNSGVGAPNPDLARQNCQLGARQVRLSRAPTAQSRVGCSVLGRGAEPLVRTQFLEHPPTLNFGANHLKKWVQHPHKPPIPFLSPDNPHCRGGFFGGGQRVRAQLEQS